MWRRVVLALDEAPEPHWLSQLVHHGSRLAILVLAAITVFVFFPAPRPADTAVLEAGVVAPHDVIAEFAFDIPKSPEDLISEQNQAASAVPPVYNHLPTARDSVLRSSGAFLQSADSIVRTTEGGRQAEALGQLMNQHRLSATSANLEVLMNEGYRSVLRSSIERAIASIYQGEILPAPLGPGVATVRVIYRDGSERLVPRDSLLVREQVYALARAHLPENLPDGVSAQLSELQQLLMIRSVLPNLAFNEVETEAARERARQAVDPVREVVLRGERIVAAHERVGPEGQARLQAYQAELMRRGVEPDAAEISRVRSLGAVFYNALVLGIFGALIFFFRRTIYQDSRTVVLLTALVLAVCGAGAVIARLGLPYELIPVTFAALIVAVLWDGRLGLSLALVLALLLAGQTPFLGVTAPFTAALAGAAAAFSVKIVQRRSQTWLFISIISLAYIAAAITMGMMRSREVSEILTSAGWGVTNAIVASLLAIGFLPLLESFTRITTDQTLLELSDPNRKLLKRLSLEAPGTYAHTINVANLAEAACHAIGANGLLARVGAYYHDIGKLVKPQYFIENQPRGRNPHDKLRPSMSAAIIRSHVLEGLKLAEAERLPDVVKRFIPEHHGTQHIVFFYNRAREQEATGHLNPADFSYPGPKPQSKETAVLMLADAVESATRALQDPTPVRIRELVERLVSQRIQEGQLDQSPLTLREIDLVKETLTGVLSGMYHHRIDYPAVVPVPQSITPAHEVVPEGTEAPVPDR